MCSITLILENRAVYEIMLKKHGTAQQATDDNTIQRMHSVCRITKATNTNSEYVNFIAFPLQKRLNERVSKLHL